MESVARAMRDRPASAHLRQICLATGLVVLPLAWLGPLQPWSATYFTGHMVLHVTLIAIAAPLLAVWLAPHLRDMRPLAPVFQAPLLAAAVEFLVMWGWHLPPAHEWARSSGLGFALEQGGFLLAATWVWTASLAPGAGLAGGLGLLLTSMHVTLLGALVTLPNRALYATCGGPGLAPLADQTLGGTLMLSIATPVYLIGGLFVVRHSLQERK